MRAATIVSLVGGSTAVAASSIRRKNDRVFKPREFQYERALSGSNEISFDDDFWGYDSYGASDTMWDDYAIEPKSCMIYNGEHVIAYELYGKGHQQCTKKSDGTYLMPVGQFAKAYQAQMQIDYNLKGADYEAPDALAYTDCTQYAYNDDTYYYVQVGCSSQGGLKLLTFSDESCSTEVSTNVGLYNDLKITFNTCQDCVSWPAEVGDDDAAQQVELDDNFDAYHMYDSKLCGAADAYGEGCGWKCRKQVKKGMNAGNANTTGRAWGGFEKFCLFFWSFAAIALVWVVLKQRRMMSREDAIVEEAAMNGVGLKKRHIFPIALGIIFFILLSMFMVWKKLTWFLLIGTNIGLFAHFVYLRRKAKKAGAGGDDGYIKDAGLEIS